MVYFQTNVNLKQSKSGSFLIFLLVNPFPSPTVSARLLGAKLYEGVKHRAKKKEVNAGNQQGWLSAEELLIYSIWFEVGEEGKKQNSCLSINCSSCGTYC